MTSPQHASHWIRSQTWDSLWIFSGVWGLVWVLLFQNTPLLDSTYLAVTFCLWIAHRISSSYLAYTLPQYRPLLQNQPLRFIAAPMVIITLVFAFLLAPSTWIPLEVTQRILILGLFDYLLNLQHFAAQHYGIIRIYGIKARHQSSENLHLKQWEKYFCLIVGGVLIFVAEALHGTVFLQEQLITPWISDTTLDAWLESIQVLATIGILGSTITLCFFEGQQPMPSLVKQAYIGSLGLLGIAAFHLPPFTFLMIWTFQHWLASVGLAGHMASKGNQSSFWRPVLLLCLVSIALTPIMEVEAVAPELRSGADWFPFLNLLLSQERGLLMLVGVGFSTGFIHYVMDRAVFRFSNPDIQRCARGLI